MRLLSFRIATGSSILGLDVNKGGKLGSTDCVASTNTSGSTVVSWGARHNVQVRLTMDGALSQVDYRWFDDAAISISSPTS